MLINFILICALTLCVATLFGMVHEAKRKAEEAARKAEKQRDDCESDRKTFTSHILSLWSHSGFPPPEKLPSLVIEKKET